MNLILALVQLILICFILFYEMKKKSIITFFWGTLLILFSLPHTIEIVLERSNYSNSTLESASLFSIGFMCLYFVLRIISSSLLKNNIAEYEIEKKEKKFEGISYFYFLLLIVSTIIVLLTAKLKFGGILNASWLDFYNLNLVMGLYNPIRYINIIFFTIAGVALYFKNNNFIIFIVSILCIGIIAFITGNRVMFIPLFLAFLIPVVLRGKNISFSKFIVLGSSVCIIVYIFYFMRVIRHTGSLSTFFSTFNFTDVNNKVLDLILSNNGELGLRNIFYYFIQNENNFDNFGEGATYIRMLFVLIPSNLSMGLKPDDFAITMGTAYSGNISNYLYSVHPTFFGDAFANFGYLGIFLAFIWIPIFWIIDFITRKLVGFNKIIFLVLSGSCLVIIARGSVYNGFFNLVIGCIIMFLLAATMKIIKIIYSKTI